MLAARQNVGESGDFHRQARMLSPAVGDGYRAAEARFSTLVHWCYGTAWGAVRGLLAGIGWVGVRRPRCTSQPSGEAVP